MSKHSLDWCDPYGKRKHILAIRKGILFPWMWKLNCVLCGRKFTSKEWNQWR